ncbi:MAG: type II secretion system protein [Clostridium sp.]|nr:type II secretion system protein [Clostridium sp.]
MLKLRKNKKGFTLVELIVVIAIMAVYQCYGKIHYGY